MHDRLAMKNCMVRMKFLTPEPSVPCRARPAPTPNPLAGRPISALGASTALQVELEVDISEGQLSRIERGETPYSQDILEAVAQVLRCEPADLIMRDPTQPDAIWSLIDTLKPVERRQAVEILKALARTGTEG
jgi:DNA-binding Xre family transcriptional regulator